MKKCPVNVFDIEDLGIGKFSFPFCLEAELEVAMQSETQGSLRCGRGQ